MIALGMGFSTAIEQFQVRYVAKTVRADLPVRP
jgi:hypothetical protein